MLFISSSIFAQVVLPPIRANVLPYVPDGGWTEVAIADEIADGSGMGDEGFGDGGGGSGISNAKSEYCDQLDTLEGLLNGLLSGNNITGTAATGYSVAEASSGIANDIFQAAYNDILKYYNSDRTMHLPFSYTNGLIDWYQAYIDWPLDSFNYLEGNPAPTLGNGGLQHIFAVWVQSVGQGNGTSVLTDPEPNTSCP